jgi:hypothetical protein
MKCGFWRFDISGRWGLCRKALARGLLAVAAIGLIGCSNLARGSRLPNSIVGTWLVKDPNAPFPYHLYVFNSDGTMQQANPDAGDPHASDSDGKGVWVAKGERIQRDLLRHGNGALV